MLILVQKTNALATADADMEPNLARAFVAAVAGWHFSHERLHDRRFWQVARWHVVHLIIRMDVVSTNFFSILFSGIEPTISACCLSITLKSFAATGERNVFSALLTRVAVRHMCDYAHWGKGRSVTLGMIGSIENR